MNSEELSDVLGPMFGAISKDGLLALQDLDLPEAPALLDVGTGEGKFAIFLALQGHEVLTGEPATDTTHYANKDWALNAEKVGVRDKIRFQAFDASDMPFEPETFDAVFFFGVLHHVDEAARQAVLSEALRVSRRRGAVVFFEPTEALLEKIWVNDPGHPMPAKPSDYLTVPDVRESRLTGEMMDIYIYRHSD